MGMARSTRLLLLLMPITNICMYVHTYFVFLEMITRLEEYVRNNKIYSIIVNMLFEYWFKNLTKLYCRIKLQLIKAVPFF